MNIFPAIDLIGGQAVRLKKGDYSQKTVYNDNPLNVAREFKSQGAKFLHLVDLDGAKSGNTDNFDVIKDIIDNSGLNVEIGGGIRDINTVRKYLNSGAMRVIIGTAAVKDPDFLEKSIGEFGEKIAVGVDIKDGFVAINGWTEVSKLSCLDFCRQMQEKRVKTIICTDISKDGMLNGTNLDLYQTLQNKLAVDIVASGGVTSIEDIKSLKNMKLYGAILGKALYAGKLDLANAIEIAKEETI